MTEQAAETDVEHGDAPDRWSRLTDENERLRAAVRYLAVAVQLHRVDMHHPGDRPCPTCGQSARALLAVGVTPYVDRHESDWAKYITEAVHAVVPSGGSSR